MSARGSTLASRLPFIAPSLHVLASKLSRIQSISFSPRTASIHHHYCPEKTQNKKGRRPYSARAGQLGPRRTMSTAAAMPLPIFRDQGTDSLPTFNFTAAPSTTSGSCNNNYNSNCNNNTSSSSPYRPSVSSPLSSSPIRASPTMTTPPLSPRDPNAGARFRAVQSSPIPETTASKQQQHSSLIFGSGGGGGGGGIASKFASRPTRPVPLNLKREAAQESRRRLFLKNVRQRAEDKRWEMRGGEQEVHSYPLLFLSSLSCLFTPRGNFY